jgi:hypothetical protein
MHLGFIENWGAVLIDGVHYQMGVYSSSEAGEMHQVWQGVL